MACAKARSAKWNRDNSIRRKEITAGYREANREGLKKAGRKYYLENTEDVKARNKEWRDSNPDVKLALTRKYQAAKLKRTPEWLSEDQVDEMRDFYTAAEMFKQYTGETYHVDHIIPLQGESVSGLHVPWNLQILPAKENLMKSNRLEESYNG
ncbi:hypothetical protein VPHD69_0053 [Vibrio phage D69]